GAIVARLTAAGVRANALGLCTYADEQRFYSYRRGTHRGEPDYGRMLSVIVLSA
ncbi:MAG TPA: laccase domain-containing protein, partial [Bauldia sp.]|nr:laccase domain-containing protein [Bauldia sp.]